MTEDIKKYRALMEQAYEAAMHTEAAPAQGDDSNVHDHIAEVLVDLFKGTSPSTDELREIVTTLKDVGQSAADIHKILDIAHQKVRSH